MITAGIDVGAKTIKVVILDNDKILAKNIITGGFETQDSIDEVWKGALEAANLTTDKIEKIFATGTGRKEVKFAQGQITEIGAAAKGVVALHPAARSVIDVGAEEGKTIRCDENGKVIDFAVNEKCAAGAGAFTEAMARALEIKLTDFGPLAVKSTKSIPINAQCAVFAESEVVSLVHSDTSKEDIAKAITDAIASRISSMVRKVGFEEDIVLIGGVAHNIGFVESLKEDLALPIHVLEDPQFIPAYGAALAAQAD